MIKGNKKCYSEIHLTAICKNPLWARPWDSRNKKENHVPASPPPNPSAPPTKDQPFINMVETKNKLIGK